MSRIAYIMVFFLLSCGDYWGGEGFDSLGEKKVCDVIKVRVRACTGVGIEEWVSWRIMQVNLFFARVVCL